MNKTHIKNTVLAAMFAALTAALTMFPRIPIPGAAGGYVHLGDAMIYLAASFLPLPFACAAGGIGGMLADIISGGAAWAPWTLVIKALIALPFTRKQDTLLCKRNYIAPAVALVITVAGYFAAEAIMYSPAAAVLSIVWNAAQGIASAAVYYVIAVATDKRHIIPFFRR